MDLDTLLNLSGVDNKVQEAVPADQIDKTRREVTVSMVAPALEKLLASYKKDQKDYYDEEGEQTAELKAQGMSDEEIDRHYYDSDYDWQYTRIDDLEAKIEALEGILKEPNGDGERIASLIDYGIGDTLAREEFGQDVKYAIKQDHPELYSKIFMYDLGESKELSESYFKDMMQDVEEGMSEEEFNKKYPGSAGEYDKIKKEIEDQMNETDTNEAVGQFADPIYDLCDEIGCDPDHPLFAELVRYLDGDTIKDFVADYRRHNMMESDIDQIAEVGKVYPKIKKMKMELVDGGMEPEEAHEKACEKYGVDPAMCDKYIEMQRDAKEGTVSEADHSKFPKVYNDDGKLVANDPATALELIADEISEQDHEAYMDAISAGDYGSLLDALDGFGYNMGTGESVEETVEVAVDDLAKVLALAGLQAQTQATEELEEYSNSPDEDYMDADMQLNKLSGGLNGPKAHHKKEYPGDNPLAAKLADDLKKALESD